MGRIIRGMFVLCLFLSGCQQGDTGRQDGGGAVSTPAGYVGSEGCATCHEEQQALWAGSHHDLAMQTAGEDSVLGDFDDAVFDYHGIESRFFRRDGKFFVHTDGADGKLHDYEISYTFGVSPLQQYLVEFPGGRLQALGLAWDTRPEGSGGQRWFHLYPDEAVDYRDELHWTKLNQNWNYMCADCHSTNLEKNYDAASGEYRTTWSDIDVGCEACHGPGSTHVEWARKAEATPVDHTDTDKGLTVQLDERAGVAWNIDQAAGHAVRSKVLEKRVELDVCGRCHARREALSPEYRPGDPLLDHFRPSLLNQELYHADGQIDDEVYVYGSFLQSRMHAKGVTCSDCHEPHSLALRFEGNALCGQCHSAARFDSHKHHHHNPGETGGQCVNCHMPARNYMVVDARRDHSFRIPRPDLSVATGTPNACNLCHADEGAQWAQEKVTAWYGEQDRQHYATAFSAANHHRIDAEEALLRVAGDQGTPGIVRGTALGLLGNGITSRSLPVIRQVTRDSDPLVRMGAVNALVALPPQLRAEMGVPLLSDPLRVIRTETARQLAGIPADVFPVSSRDALESALAEYKSVQRFNADRPESLSSLANLALQEGEIDEAERLHEQAIELAPYYVPAYVNLADLYRARGDEARSSALLIEALKKNPQSGALYHALGLAQVRMGDAEAGTASLKRACDLAPAVARYAYVYAVALNSQGQSEQALRLLRETHVQFENDQDVLFMLAAIHRDRNELEQALQYADRLIRIAPDNPDVQALRRELRNRR